MVIVKKRLISFKRNLSEIIEKFLLFFKIIGHFKIDTTEGGNHGSPMSLPS